MRLGAALLAAAPNGGAGLHREQIQLGSPDLIPAQCAALEPLRDEVHYDAVFTVILLPIQERRRGRLAPLRNATTPHAAGGAASTLDRSGSPRPPASEEHEAVYRRS